jgi:phenylacetyl-CoA:acceptor oxidoreductase subunit 2
MKAARNPAHSIPYGPAPWQQTSWDARAAGNFIGGAMGSGLVVFTALAQATGWRAMLLFGLGIGLVGLGLCSVALEIGRPLRMLNVFRNPRTSWMSREAIAAGALCSVALLAALGVSGCAWLAALLALVFAYCQARLLQAARGIPAWREPLVVPFIVLSGLAEGAGVFWLAEVVHGAGTAPLLVLLAAFIVARAMVWRAYRQRIEGRIAAPAAAALDRADARLLRLGTYAPLVLLAFALALAAVPGAAMALATIAGALVVATGARTKLALVTRAGFNQGFRMPALPVRGARS